MEKTFSPEEIQEIKETIFKMVTENAGVVYRNEFWISRDKKVISLSLTIMNFFEKGFFIALTKRGDSFISISRLCLESYQHYDWSTFCKEMPSIIKKEFTKN